MATSLSIPLSEYLGHSFHPDCDFVDGELEERNLGELDHSDLQTQIIELLRRTEYKEIIRVNAELRVQVKATRFRVPDVCVTHKSAPREQIVRTPPLLCIEVLSPEDTVNRTHERVREFLDMGVKEVWIFNPALRTVTVCVGSTTTDRSEGELTVPETSITLTLREIFSVLDE